MSKYNVDIYVCIRSPRHGLVCLPFQFIRRGVTENMHSIFKESSLKESVCPNILSPLVKLSVSCV